MEIDDAYDEAPNEVLEAMTELFEANTPNATLSRELP